MSFLDHLEELRRALLTSLAVVLVLASAAWFVSGPALELLIRTAGVGELVFLSPTEAFLTRIKVAFVLGLLAALPVILWRLWRFVLPALYAREARAIGFTVGLSTTLFLGGVAFAYLTVVPLAVKFLLGFGTPSLVPMISAGQYFGFVSKLCLGFGAMFQLPLVAMILGRIGLLTSKFLLDKWRHAIIVLAVVSALLTPPDLISQLLMLVPVLLLYGVSILLVRRVEPARRARG